VKRWFPDGRSGTPHYATALDAGRRGLPGGERALAAVASDPQQPAIVRATALSLLARYAGPEATEAPRDGFADPEALVRLGALEAAQGLDASSRLAAAPLLGDPRRAVRIEAARLLAPVPEELWSPEERLPLPGALAEYRAAQAANADRPEAHLNLGLLEADLGDPQAARREYETALRLAPWFLPAAVNLADLERALGREAEAEAVLRGALEAVPDAAGAHHALGLLLIRTGRRDEAARELERAAELAPEEPRFAYAFALALMDRGEGERALGLLDAALARRPHDAELRFAAATLARDLGRRADALRHARALAAAWPDSPEAQALLAELEGAQP
jgi:tetratricopeptide (TPR) repeat protein